MAAKGTGGRGGRGGGGAGGPSAGAVLFDGVLQPTDCDIFTGAAGASAGPNPGDGGWNYGIFLVGSNLLPSTVTYALGPAGPGAPAGEIGEGPQ
ncbi:MAG: hypothetical protein AAGA48_00045 [Myxococcota bacterium]